jgi:hypothetical protein
LRENSSTFPVGDLAKFRFQRTISPVIQLSTFNLQLRGGASRRALSA